MSMTISNIVSGAAHSAAAASTKAVPEVQRPSGEAQEQPREPVMDEYVPEEPREPSGLYWVDKGEDGQPKICFDDPEQDGGKTERCTGNTDQVDREIEALKEKQRELERQIDLATDESKIKALEQELAQVERELRQKDNDTYRRQHTVFS